RPDQQGSVHEGPKGSGADSGHQQADLAPARPARPAGPTTGQRTRRARRRGRVGGGDPAGGVRRPEGGAAMVVKDVPASQSDERRAPPTPRAGWRRFVDAAPASFDLLDEPAWVALPDPERVFYDEARCRYHSELVVVSTSTVRQVSHQGRLLT